MTTMLKARRFRIRPEEALPGEAPAHAGAARTPPQAPAQTAPTDPGNRLDAAATPTAQEATALNADDRSQVEIDAIRNEGFSGRQLRLARRVAQKHGLHPTSDFDALRLLRKAGIDPFQRQSLLGLVTGKAGSDEDAAEAEQDSRALARIAPVRVDPQLPQTVAQAPPPSVEFHAQQTHAADVLKIQRDIARRRRRRSMMLLVRLSLFVFLPTLLAGWYFAVVATPLFNTRTEFVIQQADAPGTGGMGGLLSGTQFATSQDSIAVQGYLQSREAMQRLDADIGFRGLFKGPKIDALQRLPDDASDEAAYRIYARNVKIAYDPTEGIIKMDVAGPSPAIAEAWSRALISYAEEKVDTLTSRLRDDQMRGALESYLQAETNLIAAQGRILELQERFQVLSSEVEVTLITNQITALETQLSQERLSLAQLQAAATPNRARVEPVQRRMATLESEIALLRGRLTETSAEGMSVARVQSELMVAQTEVETRRLLLSQAAQQMETARVEANRQVRYLSLSVAPVAPDVATYPRVFENTSVTMLVLLGIYLVIAMTASILREQVSA